MISIKYLLVIYYLSLYQSITDGLTYYPFESVASRIKIESTFGKSYPNSFSFISSQERVCMASSLTPAYLRIAGPSTAHMTFKNTTITIDNNIEDRPPRKLLSNLLGRNKKRQAVEKLQVASDQWKSFAMWAKATGFEIVFALNNGEKMKSGMWDPKSTLDILSVAAKAGIDDVFWQLGYGKFKKLSLKNC